jgi:transposase-like protein
MSGKIDLPGLGKMSESDARAYFERLRWPDGPVCPRCGVVNDAALIESAPDTENKVRDGLYYCRSCREPFTVTVGTALEGSHIPISKWLLGFYLYATSKKSLSALQLQRQLGLGSYRTAWHMAHRIRHAMANGGPTAPLDGTVEVDETYVGGKPRRPSGVPVSGKHYKKGMMKSRPGRGSAKTPVQVLVQRDGSARARVVPNVTAATLKPFIREHVAKTAAIHSDEFVSYRGLAAEFAGGHHVIQHAKGEYARGDVTTNSAESFNGLFKRAFHGAWHHVSREHLDRYLNEACYRWSHREATDTERTERALRQTTGVRLYYKRPKGCEGSGEGLVANG